LKILILILILAGTTLFSACKKEPVPPLPSKANPHAGMDMAKAGGMGMDGSKTDPHVGVDMNAMKGDPHASMGQNQGMGGTMGAPNPTVKAEVGSDGRITVGKLHGKLPAGWKSVPPSSSMRLAQMELTASPGDPEPGELTVFYLGSDAGGVEANIERWCAQFDQPDGKQTKEIAKREEIMVGSLKATVVEFSGTMGASTMPGMAQKGMKENWANLSAIVMTPEGPFFFKGTGPAKTMKAQKSAMTDFVKSLTFAE
jgi:hypothetical protein